MGLVHDRPEREMQLVQLRAAILLAVSELGEGTELELEPLRRMVHQANHLIRALLTPEQTQEALCLTRRLQQVFYMR